jgi:UDP-N-acetylglucosamine 4,6-dehydratase/5-epimerase
MKKVLIIGGTGSWGQELTRQILNNYDVEKIVIYSRGEHKQVDMSRKFNDSRLKFVIGDIRDKSQLKLASMDIDYMFHLAALKHVPVCERNPVETIKTNIEGTQFATEVAIENRIKTFILVSTDKAVDPMNVYGVSKSMAEKIVVSANLKTFNTKFVCIRGGNVLGTTGSVVPLFKEQILKANEITITDDRMTRYLMRLEDAISLLFTAMIDSKGGEVFVMKMPSIHVSDISKLMIKELGNDKTQIKQIGIRPGEKMHEVLVSRYEASRSFEYGDYFVILPTIDINQLYAKWNIKDYLTEEYNSLNNRFLSEDELKENLQKDGWLEKISVKELEKYSKDELLNYFKLENWSRNNQI